MQSCSDYKELPLLAPRKWQRMTGPPANSPEALASWPIRGVIVFLDCRCAAQMGRRACPQKQNPAGDGVLPAQRMAGIGEIGAIRALTAVSRAIRQRFNHVFSILFRTTVDGLCGCLEFKGHGVDLPAKLRSSGRSRQGTRMRSAILILEGRDPRHLAAHASRRQRSFPQCVLACPMPPVLPTERIAHLNYGRRLLRCGISIPAMTAWGRDRRCRVVAR